MADLEDLYAQFPRLRMAGHKITSPEADTYNCVSWIEGDTERYWDPDQYWPTPMVPTPDDPENDLDCYLALFEWLGFERCATADLEPGFLKIAIYATGAEFHHVAKQLRSGRWSSKGGVLHDFRHDDLESIEGAGVLKGARVALFMRRQDDASDPMVVEEHGLIVVGDANPARGGETVTRPQSAPRC